MIDVMSMNRNFFDFDLTNNNDTGRTNQSGNNGNNAGNGDSNNTTRPLAGTYKQDPCTYAPAYASTYNCVNHGAFDVNLNNRFDNDSGWSNFQQYRQTHTQTQPEDNLYERLESWFLRQAPGSAVADEMEQQHFQQCHGMNSKSQISANVPVSVSASSKLQPSKKHVPQSPSESVKPPPPSSQPLVAPKKRSLYKKRPSSAAAASATASTASTSGATAAAAAASSKSRTSDPTDASVGTVEIPDGVNPNDVLCGRDKTSHAHTGNKKFRQIIMSFREAYQTAPCRERKTKITLDIVQMIRQRGGRFLKKVSEDSDKFEDVGDAYAREKVSHALRSCKDPNRPKIKKKRVVPKHVPTAKENAIFEKALLDQQRIFQNLLHSEALGKAPNLDDVMGGSCGNEPVTPGIVDNSGMHGEIQRIDSDASTSDSYSATRYMV